MAPVSKLGRGKPLKNQTKEVIHKLYRYFETEIERDPNSTVTAAQLVTHSTGISINAIKRVLSEYTATATATATITVKKEFKSTRKRCKKSVISDCFDAQAIRRIIHSFYAKDEEFPVMKDLYLLLKADIDYQGSLCTLRRHVARLGFKWVEKEDNNSILIEKQNIRYARVQYLSQVEAYRSQGRNIVYTGEVVIESNRIVSKPKADGSSTMLKQPAKCKSVIFYAGDQQGVLQNTFHIYDANRRELKEENECKKENFEQYEKWFKIQLLTNLKPNSVVVVDGGSSFHNRVSNTAPYPHSRKKEIMDYLANRNVPYSPDMYKAQLYQLVLLNKDKFNDYKTDQFLREHGHSVLRLPPHHPDLNPIKSILTFVRNYVGKDVCLNVESVKKIALERVRSINPEEWNHVCRTAEAEENTLKATDKVIDDISEQTFKNNDEESEGSEVDDDNGSDDSMDSD